MKEFKSIPLHFKLLWLYWEVHNTFPSLHVTSLEDKVESWLCTTSQELQKFGEGKITSKGNLKKKKILMSFVWQYYSADPRSCVEYCRSHVTNSQVFQYFGMH